MPAPDPARTLEELRPVIDECQRILADHGMDAVQQHLADRGTSMVQSIYVTLQLIGRTDNWLRDATDIVCASPARQPAE